MTNRPEACGTLDKSLKRNETTCGKPSARLLGKHYASQEATAQREVDFNQARSQSSSGLLSDFLYSEI